MTLENSDDWKLWWWLFWKQNDAIVQVSEGEWRRERARNILIHELFWQYIFCFVLQSSSHVWIFPSLQLTQILLTLTWPQFIISCWRIVCLCFLFLIFFFVQIEKHIFHPWSEEESTSTEFRLYKSTTEQFVWLQSSIAIFECHYNASHIFGHIICENKNRKKRAHTCTHTKWKWQNVFATFSTLQSVVQCCPPTKDTFDLKTPI